MNNVLIIDPHPVVLEMMTAIARAEFPNARIRATPCLNDALKLAGAEPIDLALLDLGLPGCEGISALVKFRRAAPGVWVVVFAASEDRAVVLAALEAGAKGYIPKTSQPLVISAALRVVAAGSTYVPPQALSDAPFADPAPVALTERQRDVLRLIARGLANKEIAKELHIAKDTVKQHAKAVYQALGIGSRSQAARAAERCGIRLD